jgi:site-specific recombinase XerD
MAHLGHEPDQAPHVEGELPTRPRMPAALHVDDQLADLLGGDKAPATAKAYRSDWRSFQSWCETRERPSIPAEVDTIVSWLHDQAAAGYATATIGRRLTTIRRVHQLYGLPSPTEASPATATWSALRRRLGTAPRKVAPATIEILRRMVATCEQTPSGCRDRALLVVGFAGAMRRSELASLTVADIESHADGVIVTIRRSKGDQYGAGQRLGLPYGSSPDTCPVRTLTGWRHLADLRDGPLFRPVDRHGNIASRHLSGRAIAEIIKRRAHAAGLDPDRYSGHSLRAGFATSAAAAGATEIAIARQTRHRSMAVLRGYIREGDLFRTNAATTVGL